MAVDVLKETCEMDEMNAYLQLYQILKNEALYYTKAQDKLFGITLTISVALISLALSIPEFSSIESSRWILVLTSLFVYVLYYASVPYQAYTLKISEYIIAKIEPKTPISWSSDVKDFQKEIVKFSVSPEGKIANFIKKNLYLGIVLMCILLAISISFEDIAVYISSPTSIMTVSGIIFIVQFLVMVVVVVILFVRWRNYGQNYVSMRNIYGKVWKIVMMNQIENKGRP